MKQNFLTKCLIDFQSLLEMHEKGAEKNFELDFDIDIGEEREELQMPELSRGKYLHDFKVCSLNLKERYKWNRVNYALKIFKFQFVINCR